ncbi:MAG: CpsD/CapB family tyrosine-protein kinase, partial [Clostridia bacterium]|nr:CpsD/CapB family tyrosine-protein kinase [Clostridia bacterium]
MARRSNAPEKSYEGKLLTSRSPFAVNEAFRTLRTNLFYTSKGEKCPVYGITSCFANSGKSLLISNMAISFAQLKKRVLLLDCDLRNSVIHKIFGLERGLGISELLAGSDNAIDRAIQKTKYENLRVITSGGTPPNPTELLASSRMEKLINILKNHFDAIFIDLPPIGLVTDAVVINDLVTGFVVAVRSGFDDRNDLRETIAVMEQTNVKIVGFILNDINLKVVGKYGK